VVAPIHCQGNLIQDKYACTIRVRLGLGLGLGSGGPSLWRTGIVVADCQLAVLRKKNPFQCVSHGTKQQVGIKKTKRKSMNIRTPKNSLVIREDSTTVPTVYGR